MKRCILVMAVFAAITTFGQTLKKWEAGYLDIHHINTGRGDCTFCVLPDGTTLLIDAGEVKADVRVVAPKPDNLKEQVNGLRIILLLLFQMVRSILIIIC